MVAKPRRSAERPAREPLEVRLNVAVRFGARADDVVTVIDDRRIPMVGTVFEQRDAILRGFMRLMWRAGVMGHSLVRPKRKR